MIDKTLLRKQLDAYANLLIHNIDTHGYAPEFLTGNISSLYTTRLLCQTRSIFFLIDYASISQNNSYIEYANKLFDVVQQEYFCQTTQRYYQYPTSVNNQTTANDKMLYELAFVICSLSKLYNITKNNSIINYILKTKEFIFNTYYTHTNKFASMTDKDTGVNQNSFMHLFEAMIEACGVLNSEDSLKLDLQQFGTNLLKEIFDQNHYMIRENSYIEAFEPGHSFEWASLILEATQKELFQTKIDYNKIVTTTEKCGVNHNGLVYAEVKPNQPPNSSAFRIWPLLEQIRFYAMTNSKIKLEHSLTSLNKIFFSKDNLPYEYVNDKLEPQQVQVKATTGYHIINCYKYILK